MDMSLQQEAVEGALSRPGDSAAQLAASARAFNRRGGCNQARQGEKGWMKHSYFGHGCARNYRSG
ncbi:hypothetical protein [Blastomonas sp. AAP53]|uniref:hypothetical protein n=1 Tax=Blastomonas sp. AAP53 TaxID=1248760 RepID=UPI0002FC5848|nr:hypothetical protein [Blastomonas sp. AAP53]